MRGIWLVARREFQSYVNTTWGWAILALALLYLLHLGGGVCCCEALGGGCGGACTAA